MASKAVAELRLTTNNESYFQRTIVKEVNLCNSITPERKISSVLGLGFHFQEY
jgi:hypothetical protein